MQAKWERNMNKICSEKKMRKYAYPNHLYTIYLYLFIDLFIQLKYLFIKFLYS